MKRKAAFFELLRRSAEEGGWDEREAKRRMAHRGFLCPPSPITSTSAPTTSTSSTTSGAGAAASAGKSSKRDTRAHPQATSAPNPDHNPGRRELFHSLSFFYIPNDDVSPVRRLRIQRAQKHGAKWVRDAAEATHVVVDKGLTWGDIQGLLEGRGDAVEAKAKVVSEEWPLECVTFGALLDEGQKKYAVKGRKGRGEGQNEEKAEEERVRRGSPTRTIPAEEPGDELSKWISMVQEFKHLPLDGDDDDDDDDDDAQSSASAEPDEHVSSESESEGGERAKKRAKKKKKKKKKEALDDFACHHAGEQKQNASTSGPNARTIEILSSMKDYYDRTRDPWRTLAYRKAIATLRRQPVAIRSRDQALRLPGIGARLADKIEEIVTTDRLRRLEHAEHSDPTDRSLEVFLKIYGVGSRLAGQWVAQGLRTLEDVRDKARLTAAQRIGVERYEELNTRIPRAEVAALGEVVGRAAGEMDPLVRVVVGGSYRRGAESSHDIDIVLTREDADARELGGFLGELVSRLEGDGFLVARLASSSSGSKWHGCCVLPGKEVAGKEGGKLWRRIDFLAVPGAEIGAAMLYFTGNDVFNRSMRLLARRKGMRLNQRGLYGCGYGSGSDGGELIEGRDERRIFDILGVKWREPHERWC